MASSVRSWPFTALGLKERLSNRSPALAASSPSSVSAELGELAAKAGLRLDSRSFKPKAVKGHDLTELAIDAQVIGDYRGVVRFLNGLQRSKNFYAVEGLSARSFTQKQGARGALQVTVHIKTYFRAA